MNMVKIKFAVWTVDYGPRSYEATCPYIPRLGEKVHGSFYNQSKYGEATVKDVSYNKDNVVVELEEIDQS
jgi:hypothetical protein